MASISHPAERPELRCGANGQATRKTVCSIRKAVFLDRDGVLNRAIMRQGKATSPRSLAELEILAGVEPACRKLRTAGFSLVVVTNQPEIARGIQTFETLDAINHLLQTELEIDSVRVCPHDDSDGCVCRKPKPGMLLEAAAELRIDLVGSFLVGDRWRDVEAGQRAGCRTIFIDGGYEELRGACPDFTARSLAEAAEWILGEETGGIAP